MEQELNKDAIIKLIHSIRSVNFGKKSDVHYYFQLSETCPHANNNYNDYNHRFYLKSVTHLVTN